MTFKTSQNGKLIILKLEQEAAIRVQSVVRMSLQSIYQIPIRNYMVTALIYMSLRGLCLKDMF